MLLITGHKGFIGSHLTKYLDEKKVKWVGYDLVDGQDIRNTMQLDKFFEENQITQVIHLAALAGVRRGNEYPDEYISTNIKGTWNIVKLSEKYGIERFLNFGSSSMFGNGCLPIGENASRKPVSLYGMTKVAGESILKSSKIKKRITIIPFTVYGENGRRDEVIYRWLEQYKNNKAITIYGDGSSERGYVYVKDLVEAVFRLLVLEKEVYNTTDYNFSINLGGSEIVTINDLVNLFLEELPNISHVNVDMPETDIYQNYADTEFAKLLIDFNPIKRFDSVVRNIIKSEIKKYEQ